ncbi:dihydroxyacetone kinase family protein [Corynebacterium pilbarense]|uniref:Dihydroxyacetone kinase family protein n=1 Tax=Corynebacterium pilbarense TaxID=1288393 RepID=A0A9Q4IH45_9CORY|nr:dihydroxyacetone kinase family protein [Corynebacterium pilbarense]MCZ2220831.1 dihydroxyacetone kinase family protein [Corynebacterium pilbarense]
MPDTFKSFRNATDHFMREALGGLVAAHPCAQWHDEGFVGLSLDDATKGEQRVAVISGGGSGHEPMHAGFIGSGMLDAACPGLLFTSPNAVQIGAATEWADRGNGVVHVVKNYTGDVMNFTVAANHADVEVAQVLVDDDVATEIDNDDSPGRRGTGATVIVEKVAGAAAARGDDLQAVAEVAQRAADQSRSMAVALQPGHSPTSDRATFDLADGQIEIGVGIHGEPGVERRDIAGAQLTAAALVEELLDGILGSLGNPSGDVMLFVNGLGGTSQLEQDLIFGEALKQLTDRGLKVRRGMRGTLVTSLNMAGISLTLTVLDDELTELIDASTAAPAWPGTVNDPEYAEAILVDNETQPDSGEENAWLSRFVERLGASYDDLTALDREAGDGDFGQNMEAAFGDVVTPVRGADADVLNFFAHRMLVRAGGTSGAVLGTFFRQMADAFAGVDSRDADGSAFAEALAEGLERGVDAITQLGGAKEGDNTLVDALAPAARAAKDATGSVDEVLAHVFAPAVEGAKATRGMQAKKGRASYLGESAKHVPDPGAIAVTWLFGEAGVDEF